MLLDSFCPLVLSAGLVVSELVEGAAPEGVAFALESLVAVSLLPSPVPVVVVVVTGLVAASGAAG